MGEIAEIMLTDSQQRAFDKMTQFVHDEAKRVFILKGYAGTGKTTLMKILIGALKQENISFSFFIIYHLSRNMRHYYFYNLQLPLSQYAVLLLLQFTIRQEVCTRIRILLIRRGQFSGNRGCKGCFCGFLNGWLDGVNC